MDHNIYITKAFEKGALLLIYRLNHFLLLLPFALIIIEQQQPVR